MQQIDVSVIIPIYHTKPRFLQQCLESVEHQFEGLHGEIIAVCDGPQDQELMTVLHTSSAYIIETDHRGVSHARNCGLSHASGEYIFFVDSDDWLAEGAIASMVKFARKNSCDLTLADRVSVMGMKQERHKYAQSNIVQTHDSDIRLMKDILHPQTSAGLIAPRLILRKVLADLHFNEHIAMGEDSEFMLRLSQKVRNFGYLHQPLYFYRRNTTSAVMQFRSDYVDRIVLSMNTVQKTLQQLRVANRYRQDFNSYVAYHLTLVLVNYVCNPSNQWSLLRKRNELKAILHLPLFSMSLRDVDYSSFSLTRKITVRCLQLHMLWLCIAIGHMRQLQIRRK